MGPSSRRGKPQFCKLCVDAHGRRVPMKGHKLQCPARTAQLADMITPFLPTSPAPPIVNTPISSSSSSSSPSPSFCTTPSPSPTTSIAHDFPESPSRSPSSYVDMSLFDFDDIFDALHSQVHNDNFPFPASSPLPYTPTNITLPTADLFMPPPSVFFSEGTALGPPSPSSADMGHLVPMDCDDTPSLHGLTPYDFNQFFNITTPQNGLPEQLVAGGNTATVEQVTACNPTRSPSNESDAAMAAPSEPIGVFVVHTESANVGSDSQSARTMDEHHEHLSNDTPGPRVHSSRAVGVRKFSSMAVTKRKKMSKDYVFLDQVHRRKNEHSRMAANILDKIRALDQKTAPFILAFIARPESILDGQGRIHTYMSDNLRRILGDTLIEEIHQKVMNYCHQQTGQQIEIAIDINLQAERVRRIQAEEQLAAMRLEVAQLRALVQATPEGAIV